MLELVNQQPRDLLAVVSTSSGRYAPSFHARSVFGGSSPFSGFLRKSKSSELPMYVKAIGDGAASWFDQEHADENGDPLPRHFPCANKGWICSPGPRPCARGNPLYSARPARWEHACWRKLKFGIHRAHYGRYCYRADVKGTSATFIVTAQTDLDCDGVFSSYVQKGHVDPKTGEVLRSNLLIRNVLE